MRAPYGSPAHIVDGVARLDGGNHVIHIYRADARCCPDRGLDDDHSSERLERLYRHLDATVDSPVTLVGEAAGWRGARQTGLPFTAPGNLRPGAMREASATVVQAALADHRLAVAPRLFNAYPLHPHHSGRPRSNRAPTSAELASARPVLQAAVLNRFVIAVGQKAADSWANASGEAVMPVARTRTSARAVAVRHPSFGGANQFRIELAAALAHFGFVHRVRT